MSELISTVCPGCGADVPVPSSVHEVRCTDCGRSFERSPAVRRTERLISVIEPSWRRTSSSSWVGKLIGAVILISVISIGATFSIRSSSLDDRKGIVPEGEHMQWDPRAPPLVVEGENGEDALLVGRYRVANGDGDTTLHVGAFETVGFKRIWATDSLGQYDTDLAYRYSQLARVANRIVLTLPKGAVQLLDLEDGHEVGELPLSDRAVFLCSLPDNENAWVEVADGQNLLVDVPVGTTRPSQRPGPCRDRTVALPAGCEPLAETAYLPGAECRSGDAAPAVEGFRPARVLVDGARAVALGEATAGPATPMAVGFGVQNSEALWQRPIPEIDPELIEDGTPKLVDLAGGRLVAQYGLKAGGYRLIAIDAATGKTRWDVAVPRSQEGGPAETMRVTHHRIYLPHWTWLDVFDIVDGKHIATLGRW